MIPNQLSLIDIQNTTQRNRTAAERQIRQSLEYLSDENKLERKAAQLCRYCFYFMRGRMVMNACTDGSCRLCSGSFMWGNSNTPILCSDCSSEKLLCRQCGGDMEMRPNRRSV